MAALTADRATPMRDGVFYSYPVAAATKIYQGSLVCLDSSGNAEPMSAATGKIPVGRAEEQVDNSSGAAAALNIKVRAGVFKWGNSGSNTLDKSHIGDTVYGEDDQTVGSLATGMSRAGTMVDFESDGVWVQTNPPEVLVSGLAAANNLSDVASAATAATNLGLGTGDSPTFTDVTTTDDITCGDDLAVTGLATVGETLTVTGQASLDGGFDLGTGSPVRKHKRTSLAAADIQTLNATPVQLVAAAAGKVHVPVLAVYNYTHVANAYDSVGAGEDFRIQWATGTVQAMPDLDTTSDINFGAAASDVAVIHADNAVKQKPVTNDDLEVTILSGEIYAAAGDGTLIIDLYYDEYTV